MSSNSGPATPVLVWSYRTAYEFSASAPPPALGSDGRIYTGSDDSNVYVIQPTGQLLTKGVGQ